MYMYMYSVNYARYMYMWAGRQNGHWSLQVHVHIHLYKCTCTWKWTTTILPASSHVPYMKMNRTHPCQHINTTAFHARTRAMLELHVYEIHVYKTLWHISQFSSWRDGSWHSSQFPSWRDGSCFLSSTVQIVSTHAHTDRRDLPSLQQGVSFEIY